MPALKKIKCPQCGTETEWNKNNQWRPFCSERCKLIDFGDWAEENNIIAGHPIAPWQMNEDKPLN